MRFASAILAPIVLAGVVTASISSAPAVSLRTKPVPFRLQVRHADPWAVKMMLEGIEPSYPEIGVLILSGAYTMAAAQAAAGAMFTGGHLIVNSGDNSLWFIPDRN